MTQSKKKGNAFERTVANYLTENFQPIKFNRNTLSGSFLGGKNSSRILNFSDEKAETMLGDVYSSNENLKFNIECKNYNIVIPFQKLLDQNCIIYEWFNESVKDALKLNKVPLLIFKLNRTKIYFVTYYSELPLYKSNLILSKDNNIAIGLLEDLVKNYNECWWIQ